MYVLESVIIMFKKFSNFKGEISVKINQFCAEQFIDHSSLFRVAEIQKCLTKYTVYLYARRQMFN